MTESTAFSGPRDAAVMEAILKEMGVEDFEPNVIHQMLEFSYGYVTSVLEDARVYSEHAQKKELDISDVKLAVQTRMDHSFTAPPPRDFLMEVARKKNATALPLIPEKFGPRLPPERYCLTANNYKVMERQKKSSVSRPQVTLSATFRVPGKPPAITTSTSGSTAMASPSSPSSTSSILRTQLSSPLLQTTSNPLTAPSGSKISQASSMLSQLTQQQQQAPIPMDQGLKGPFNRNTNNNNVSTFRQLGKHPFYD